MVYKENEEVYLTLPRKDLQGLCKKHRLCTNHSKEELAKNLVIYFTKKKELSMKRSKKNGRVGTSSKLTRLSSGKSKHDKENTLSERNVKGDRSACSKMADVKKKHSHKVDKVQNLNAISASEVSIAVPPALVKYNQVAEVIKQAGKFSLNHGTAKVTSKIGRLTDRENSLKKSVEIPASFQFYVRSEEGINLFVDFNTNTSDWINSLKDEVSIQQKTHRTNSWTICNEVKDARNITKSLESFGVNNKLLTNEDSSHDSRSQALSCHPSELMIYMDEKNEPLPSSRMTCSHVQKSGTFCCLSYSANAETPHQNPDDSPSVGTKTNGSVACDSSNKILCNLDVNLSKDTTVTDRLVLNGDYISSCNPELVSPGNLLKCINGRDGLSLSEINKDCSKPSENNVIDNCIDKKLILPQSDADKLTNHFFEDDTGHAISSVKKSISSNGDKVKCVQEQLKETIHQRCKMVKRCKRTCTTDIHVDVLSKKRQHVDGGDQSERPRNLRKTKTLARESSGAQSLLRRRSVRLGSK